MLPKSLLLLLFASFIEAEYYSYPTNTFTTQSCPHPKIDHGRARIRQRTSRLVKFMCAPRYELVGNRYATCRNGQWDVPMPVCVRPGCDDLPPSTNSIQIKEHRDAWVVTFCLPGHKLIGSTAVYCDGHKWNDTAAQCVDATTATSLSCDFEDPNICGWTQDELHDFDWKRWNKKTPSYFLFTGPSYDHTYGKDRMGYYMYIESTGEGENTTARLLSPVYDRSLAVNGCFSFYYHMFGSGIGGLRVYQKPNSLLLSDVLNQTGDEKYLLFEAWGTKGDTWFSAAPQLKFLGDDFQIVIEGIRGNSFTSDIAVDDVAILQGERCVTARQDATTPEPASYNSQSCSNRCNVPAHHATQCDCTPACFINGNCCNDYIDYCVYPKGTSNSDDDSSSTDTLPETQKLVGETTTSKSTTASKTTTTTTTITTAKPTTTIKPTTTTESNTTAKATTPTITKQTTTTKPTTKAKATTTQPKTTTKPPTTTTKRTTTTKPTTLKPKTTAKLTAKPTTTKPTTTKPTSTKPTTTKPTTRKLVAITKASAKPFKDDSDIEKKKHEMEVNLNKMVPEATKQDKQSKSSTWKTTITTIVVLAVLTALIYVVVTSRTARGRQALARLRGRANHDSEVRYLNSADDDVL